MFFSGNVKQMSFKWVAANRWLIVFLESKSWAIFTQNCSTKPNELFSLTIKLHVKLIIYSAKVTMCDLCISCLFPAQHWPSWRPSRALWGEGGSGGGGWLWHLHGHPLRQADWQLLLCCPGHADWPEEVSLCPPLSPSLHPLPFEAPRVILLCNMLVNA